MGLTNFMKVKDILSDMYDVRRMARLTDFGLLPKDNEGTQMTINECLDDCCQKLEDLL